MAQHTAIDWWLPSATTTTWRKFWVFWRLCRNM